VVSSPNRDERGGGLAKYSFIRYSIREAFSLIQVSSSIGRVAVSKTVGWGFESLLACQRKSRKHPQKVETLHMSRIRKYISEVFLELKKATWPWDPKEKGFAKYRELNESTVVVFIAMVLLGAFVAAFDVSFKWAFEAAQKLGM
jgi:preprotein translocase subunit SecE